MENKNKKPVKPVEPKYIKVEGVTESYIKKLQEMALKHNLFLKDENSNINKINKETMDYTPDYEKMTNSQIIHFGEVKGWDSAKINQIILKAEADRKTTKLKAEEDLKVKQTKQLQMAKDSKYTDRARLQALGEVDKAGKMTAAQREEYTNLKIMVSLQNSRDLVKTKLQEEEEYQWQRYNKNSVFLSKLEQDDYIQSVLKKYIKGNSMPGVAERVAIVNELEKAKINIPTDRLKEMIVEYLKNKSAEPMLSMTSEKNEEIAAIERMINNLNYADDNLRMSLQNQLTELKKK